MFSSFGGVNFLIYSPIDFNNIPSNQKVIIAEIIGMSTGELSPMDIDVSLPPEENVLVPKLSILINEDGHSVTRHQLKI